MPAHDQTMQPAGCLPLLVRLTWMIFGNLALAILGVLVAQGKAPIITDLGFWLMALSLAGVRYVDIVRFHGDTSEGKPATLEHWRRYVVILALVAGALYAGARVVNLGVL